MTKQELAEYLKVTERTVDKLREKGLPSFKVGKSIRFDKNKVLKWLEENQEN